MSSNAARHPPADFASAATGVSHYHRSGYDVNDRNLHHHFAVTATPVASSADQYQDTGIELVELSPSLAKRKAEREAETRAGKVRAPGIDRSSSVDRRLQAPGEKEDDKGFWTFWLPRVGRDRLRFWEEALRRRRPQRQHRLHGETDRMKFSHSLQFNAVPDWSAFYIAYSNLKKL